MKKLMIFVIASLFLSCEAEKADTGSFDLRDKVFSQISGEESSLGGYPFVYIAYLFEETTATRIEYYKNSPEAVAYGWAEEYEIRNTTACSYQVSGETITIDDDSTDHAAYFGIITGNILTISGELYIQPSDTTSLYTFLSDL